MNHGELSRRQVLSVGAMLPVAGALSRYGTSGHGPRPELRQFAQNVVIPAGSTAFVPLGPTRLADTRPGSRVAGFTAVDAVTIRVPVAGVSGVPATATAAVLNVTGIAPAVPGGGFATVYPAGSVAPLASNLNFDRPGETVANLVTVQLGTGGAVDIASSLQLTDFVVDLVGVYVSVDVPVSAGRFVGLPTSQRVLDTRGTGQPVTSGPARRLNLGDIVPAGASAVVINLTVTNPVGTGYWTAFAAGAATPATSNLNAGDDSITTNQAIVPIGTIGQLRGIDIYTSHSGHLIVDVAGYFTGETDAPGVDGLFVPSAPTRKLDTRTNATNPASGRFFPGWIAEFDFLGRAQASSVVVNLTASLARGEGYFTAFPARTAQPLTSNLNATAPLVTVSNHAIVRASTAGVAFYTQAGAALIADVAGYYTGTPVATTTPAPVNVVPVGVPLPYHLAVPGTPIDATVLAGSGPEVLDNAYVGHIDGSPLLGEDLGTCMILIANRTTGGGVFRFLDTVTVGAVAELQAADGSSVVYRYTCVARAIVLATAEAVHDEITRAHAPSEGGAKPDLVLVAKSKPDFTPTDSRYFMVVSFLLNG